jgi:hypothetical protein
MGVHGKMFSAEVRDVPIAGPIGAINPAAGTILKYGAEFSKLVEGGIWIDGEIDLAGSRLTFVGNKSNPLFFGRRPEVTLVSR